MRYADLICIGSQKAATTWLHRMLARHPRVFTPVLKEIHYFDVLHVPEMKSFQKQRINQARRLLHEKFELTLTHRVIVFMLSEILRNYKLRRYLAELRLTAAMSDETLDDDWYASNFERARADQITCDFTTSYALLPPAGIEHVRRLSPDARVVYVVRDPIERALSHARMLVVRNGAPQTEESLRKFLDSWMVRSRDDSIATIDAWEANWPREQFRLLFYDDVQNRPYEVLEDVCRFVGLPYKKRYFRGAAKPVYQGPAIPETEEIRSMLRERFAPLLAELAYRYPEPAARWGKPDPHQQSAPRPHSADAFVQYPQTERIER